MKTLLAIYAVSGSGYTIVNAVNFYNSGAQKEPFQIAFEIFITALWIILFYILTYIIIHLFSNSLIGLGKWYPDFWYLPKIRVLANVTSTNEIELVFQNKKKNSFTFEVFYHLLDSEVEELPDKASGIAPDNLKQLLPLVTMTGKDKLVKKVGKIDNGFVILSAGEGNGNMIVKTHGTYHYWIRWYGEFRGREYEDSDKITIKLQKNGVSIER